MYAFRGSDKRFIDRFAADYPGAARFRLSRSFRCAAPVINAAGRLVDTSLQGAGGDVTLYRAGHGSDKAEGEAIARRIAALIGGATFFAQDSGVVTGPPRKSGLDCRPTSFDSRNIADPPDNTHGDAAPRDCAVLLRTLGLAEPIVKALNDHGIPYVLQNDESRQIEAAGVAVEGVRIMTIHAAKGLEFPHVFVPALEEGILPFTLYDDREDPGFAAHVEEENRLLYVAMTRARQGLYLSWAKHRSFRHRQLDLPPSPFLAVIEDLVPLRRVDRARKREEQGWLF
jgi:superfamily I DNA/RNA helicase